MNARMGRKDTILYRFISALVGLLLLTAPAMARNLIVNPGFEAPADATGWVGFGTATPPTASSEQAYRGGQSALVVGRTASYMGLAQDIAGRVKAGVGYDVRAWVRLRQPGAAVISLGVKIVDAAGTRYLTLDWRSALPAGRWVKLGGYYRHQPGDGLRELKLYVNGPAAGRDFFVDQVSLSPPPAYAPPPATDADFVRAAGEQLVVGAAATPIRLLGVNFTAYGDDDEAAETVLGGKHFDQEDFVRVRQAGMNVVRLNSWYKLFEDDARPYVYKQEGWRWLEKMLTWAGRAGVYLILDMHAPQCGYQGPGYAGAFWGDDPACRDRLKALWQAIARRYAGDPRIAAFDLLNEPNPGQNRQWVTYANQLVAAIRSADPRRLILAEQSFAADSAPFLLDDDNVLYDFHFYDPWRHSAQLLYSSGYGDNNTPYPDAGVNVLPWSYQARGLLENPALPAGDGGWQWHAGPILTVTDGAAVAALPVLISRTSGGRVWLDDFQVTEYAPDGRETRRIHNIDIEKRPAEWYLLTATDPFLSFSEFWRLERRDGSTAGLGLDAGHRGRHALVLDNSSQGLALLKNDKLLFAVRPGYGYRISGWLKGEGLSADAVRLGLQLQGSGETARPFVKDTLEHYMLTNGLAYYRRAGRPVNMGEFGQANPSFANGRGGLAWAADVLDLMDAHGLSGQWFTWRGIEFGIHGHLSGYPDPRQANQPLLELIGRHWR